jgi:hypothetical protein
VNCTLRIIFLSSLFSSLLFCFCTDPVSPRPHNYVQGNKYVSGDAGLELSVPSGWHLSADTTVGVYHLRLIGLKDISAQFRPNLNLYWEGHSGTSDMNTILDTAENMVMSTFQGSSTVSKKTVIIDNVTCGELVFLAAISGFSVKEKQLYIIHNNKDIIITFTDLQSNYSNSVMEFDSIQASILLK